MCIDGTTLLKFRRLLERDKLCEQLQGAWAEGWQITRRNPDEETVGNSGARRDNGARADDENYHR